LNYQENIKLLKDNNNIVIAKLENTIKLQEKQLTIQPKENQVSSCSQSEKCNHQVSTLDDFAEEIAQNINSKTNNDKNNNNSKNIQSISKTSDSSLEKSENDTRIVLSHINNNLSDAYKENYIDIVEKKSKNAENNINSSSNSSSSCNNSNSSNSSNSNCDNISSKSSNNRNSNTKKKNKIRDDDDYDDFSCIVPENIITSDMNRRKRRQTDFYANKAIDRMFFVAPEIKNGEYKIKK
jgi:hypothetical protein